MATREWAWSRAKGRGLVCIAPPIHGPMSPLCLACSPSPACSKVRASLNPPPAMSNHGVPVWRSASRERA